MNMGPETLSMLESIFSDSSQYINRWEIQKKKYVPCKQAMTLVAWKQENVKENTGGEPTIIL